MPARHVTTRSPASISRQMPVSPFEMTVIGFLIVGVLYVAQFVLMPLALAVILSFVLAPPVRALRRAGLGNTPAVLLVVAVAFAIIFAVGGLIAQQLTSLVQELPRYQLTLRDKVKSVRHVTEGSGGAIKQASETLKDLQQQLEAPQGPPSPAGDVVSPMGGPLPSEGRPIPVEVHTPSPTPLDQLETIIGLVIEPLATGGLVLLFVLFLLLQREDVRDRTIRLLGAKDLEKSTMAMDDAGSRLSRYFLTLTAINTGYGIFIASGLWMIGVPSPVLWGVLAMLMRFVPFIGSFVAAVVPLILAAAVDPGWTMFLSTLALYVLSEPIMGNVIEPVVQGQRTGLSPLAIVLSAAFWTLLWGPIGLLLAIPLTVVLVVLGHHVERLEFLNILLGDAPSLTPAQRFYQRMLAGDPSEALEQAETFIKTASLVDYYDEVFIEGLRLAQADANRGSLDVERLTDIRDTAEIVIDTLADHEIVPGTSSKAQPAGDEQDERPPGEQANFSVVVDQLDSSWCAENAVLCVASRTALDEVAAMALAQIVGKCGLGGKVIGVDQLRHGVLSDEDAEGIRLVCISALDVRERSAHARFLVRRLKRSASGALLLGCFWKLDPKEPRDRSIIESVPVDATAHTLREAVIFAIEAARGPTGREETVETRQPASATI